MTIAQIVYDNELSFGYTDEEIHEKVASGSAFFRFTTDPCFRSLGSGRSWMTASGRECRHLRRLFPEDLVYNVEPRCYTEG